jgi:hypothetical protein
LKWWCRGCGEPSKKEALENHGYSKEVTDRIYKYQFGRCGLHHVPCYFCNKNDVWSNFDKLNEENSIFAMMKRVSKTFISEQLMSSSGFVINKNEIVELTPDSQKNA